ncbi:MAG: hypothetical protein K0R21_111 [Anaerocolumna sp.]|jgi:uncharacterized protein (TIGR02679 family)|nr:hypothetical protein [Anaerocolumna sp.]
MATLQEAVSYFKNNKGYDRLFLGIQDKYASLGLMGGSVTLADLRAEEREVLEGLFHRSFRSQQSASVSIVKLEKALKTTKFGEFTLKEIVEGYFVGTLSANRELRERAKERQEHFFNSVIRESGSSIGIKWLSDIFQSREVPYKTLLHRYHTDHSSLRSDLLKVMKALDCLPVYVDKVKRLPVFAAEISGNPHYLDEGSDGDRLFTYALCKIWNVPYQDVSIAEQKAELLYKAGILKDELSNYTVCYNIKAWKKDNSLHEGIEGFRTSKETVIFTIETIKNLSKVEGLHNLIYVVENPSVFGSMKDSHQFEDASLMCTNGNLRLASLLTLDLLAKSNTNIYYAGDFDPEGILIAAKLKNRYKDLLTLWHYTVDDYKLALSNEHIDDKRLHKLDKVECEELKDTIALMKELKRAGYQENMISLF